MTHSDRQSSAKNIPVRRVALGIPLNRTYGRRILQGIITYARRYPYWDFAVIDTIPYLSWPQLQRWDGDGMIVAVYNSTQARALRDKGIPVVNVSSAKLTPPLPTVHADNASIGRSAARHLIEKGRETFAFFGVAGAVHDLDRLQGFQDELKRRGFSCQEYLLADQIVSRKTGLRRIMAALQRIKTPVGIMAATDGFGFNILQACRRLKLSVPEQVALIACDNDEIFSSLATVSMTSIDPAADQVGYQAAAMLDQLMRGVTPAALLQLIPPRGVEIRDSTNLTVVNDIHVAEALRFIRNHAGEFIDVSDVMRVVPISRRSLERRFLELTTRSLYQEIQRVHIERAQQLLAETDQPVVEVAYRSGYHTLNRFEVNFRRIVGHSPSKYRQSLAARSSAKNQRAAPVRRSG